GALASHMANRNENARSRRGPGQGEGSRAKETGPGRGGHMSTGGLGERAAAQPGTRDMGTGKKKWKTKKNAAVCSGTPVLHKMGMICTITPVFGIRRNAVPPVRFQKAQECKAWRILYSSGGRQADCAHRVRRVVGERGGA